MDFLWKYKKNLEECKIHCEIHGASILTYVTEMRSCACCSDSTSFNAYFDGGDVYKIAGTANISISIPSNPVESI